MNLSARLKLRDGDRVIAVRAGNSSLPYLIGTVATIYRYERESPVLLLAGRGCYPDWSNWELLLTCLDCRAPLPEPQVVNCARCQEDLCLECSHRHPDTCQQRQTNRVRNEKRRPIGRKKERSIFVDGG